MLLFSSIHAPTVTCSRDNGGALIINYGGNEWLMSFPHAAALARMIDQELHDDFLTTAADIVSPDREPMP